MNQAFEAAIDRLGENLGPEATDDLEVVILEASRLRVLAANLLSALASLSSAYTMETIQHPEDEIRILHLERSRTMIRTAREVLYGDALGTDWVENGYDDITEPKPDAPGRVL